MSEPVKQPTTYTVYHRHSVPFLFTGLFIALKLSTTALTDWSWWWVFMPIVPDFAFALTKLGV